MEITDLAYAAGILDGEGSISLIMTGHKPSKSLTVVVQVANTNEWLVQWFKLTFGGWVTTTKKPRGKNWKIGFQWRVTAIKALTFLELIYPYLRLKKPQAEIAITFQKMRGCNHRWLNEKEKAIGEAQRIVMSGLNKKGIEKIKEV